MLKVTKTLFLVLVFTSSFAQSKSHSQDSWRATLVKVFQKAKQYSVYRQQINWNTLEKDILKEAPSPISFEDFKHRIQLLFLRMGDRHAALFVNGNRIRAVDTPLVALRSTLIDQLKNTDLSLRTQILEDKYGYILIPSNNTRDNLQALGQAIQDSLCSLLHQQLTGIIIDLRANEGGSIYPLFTGLHPLIGDGVFGAFSDGATFKTAWKLKNGKLYQGKQIVASVKPTCHCSQKMKVAVLLSQVTASAGEMLAIAFKGRKNTLFIGENTYGLTTGNVTFKIDGHLLALSASFSEDRTGKVYKGAVTPDIEIIEGDNFSDLSKDKKVLEALKWF